MGTAERRNEIMRILCRRRYEKITNLAFELGVCPKTIQRDIGVLSLTEPIYTQTGRYGGGVYVVEGYHIDRIYMSDKESKLLWKILHTLRYDQTVELTSAELEQFEHIVEDYTKPTTKERN